MPWHGTSIKVSSERQSTLASGIKRLEKGQLLPILTPRVVVTKVRRGVEQWPPCNKTYGWVDICLLDVSFARPPTFTSNTKHLVEKQPLPVWRIQRRAHASLTNRIYCFYRMFKNTKIYASFLSELCSIKDFAPDPSRDSPWAPVEVSRHPPDSNFLFWPSFWNFWIRQWLCFKRLRIDISKYMKFNLDTGWIQ